MIKNTDLKVGDQVFFLSDNTVLGDAFRAVGQKVGHVGVVYDLIKDQSGKILVRLAEVDVVGTKMGIYDIENMKNISVKRYQNYQSIIDPVKMLSVIKNTYDTAVLTKNNKYSIPGVLDTVINLILKTITFGYWKKEVLLPPDPNYICSEFVARIYNIYFNFNFYEKIQILTPQEMYEDIRFITIKAFNT